MQTRFMALCTCVFLLSASLPAQEPTKNNEDLARLRWMAQQIGVGAKPGEIDPRLMEMAKQFMKDNPNFMNDPALQKKKEELKKQFQNNPAELQKLLKQQGVDQQQMQQMMEQMRNQPGGNQPAPNGQNPNNPNVRPLEPNQIPPQIQPQPQPQPPRDRPGAGTITPPQVPPPPSNPPGANGQPQIQPPSTPPGVPPNITAPRGYRIVPPEDIANQRAEAERKARSSEGYNTVAGMWESSVGPLDNTPEMKRALIDAFSGSESSMNGFGKSDFWKGRSGDSNFMRNMRGMFDGNGNGMSNWFKNLGGRFNANSFSWLKPNGWNMGTPSTGTGMGMSGWSFGAGGLSGLGAMGIVVVVLVAVLVAAFLLYRYWPQIVSISQPKPLPGRGPWPVDPRDVKDRASLIQCFEYISVNLCGDEAAVWNHMTIAEAFRQQIPNARNLAEPLARAYALARYTPVHEELSQLELSQARAALCQLAGVAA